MLFIYNFVNVHYLLDCVRVLCSAGDLSRFVVIYGDCQRLMTLWVWCQVRRVDRITNYVYAMPFLITDPFVRKLSPHDSYWIWDWSTAWSDYCTQSQREDDLLSGFSLSVFFSCIVYFCLFDICALTDTNICHYLNGTFAGQTGFLCPVSLTA